MSGRATVFITRRAEFAAAHRLSSPRLSDRENARLYVPLVTMLVISVALTLLVNLFRRLF